MITTLQTILLWRKGHYNSVIKTPFTGHPVQKIMYFIVVYDVGPVFLVVHCRRSIFKQLYKR